MQRGINKSEKMNQDHVDETSRKVSKVKHASSAGLLDGLDREINHAPACAQQPVSVFRRQKHDTNNKSKGREDDNRAGERRETHRTLHLEIYYLGTTSSSTTVHVV